MTDPARRGDDPTRATTTLDAARLAMATWLTTGDARAAAQSELHRVGASFYDAEDLLHDVAVKVLQTETVPDNPIAYARRALGHQAVDLFRGERIRTGRNTPLFGGDDDGLVLDLEDDDPGPSEIAAVAFVEDSIRRSLHAALSGAAKVWAVAAALTTLTLRVHRDVSRPDEVPDPDIADEGKADRWAALWLAGERDVFPDAGAGRVDDDARRQARSRKLREVGRLLREVSAAALGGDDDD